MSITLDCVGEPCVLCETFKLRPDSGESRSKKCKCTFDKNNILVRFEVLMATSIKMTAFWKNAV
jgi:hypothetical protein